MTEKPFMFIDQQNNIVKITILPVETYGVSEILIKIPISLFMESRESIKKFTGKHKKP
jgi:hypothetical protein